MQVESREGIFIAIWNFLVEFFLFTRASPRGARALQNQSLISLIVWLIWEPRKFRIFYYTHTDTCKLYNLIAKLSLSPSYAGLSLNHFQCVPATWPTTHRNSSLASRISLTQSDLSNPTETNNLEKYLSDAPHLIRVKQQEPHLVGY